MKIKERLKFVYDYLRGDPEFLDNLDWLTFLISLIPVEGVKQVSQVANKLISDKSLRVKFDEIKSLSKENSGRLDKIESEAERISEIPKVIDSDDHLKHKVEDLVTLVKNQLQEENSEFLMETSKQSIQVLIKQMIDVDWAAIIATDHSHNYLKDTKIKARKTYLKAHNNSSNVIDGTEFSDDKGSVRMQGITQRGDISVTGNFVGFGPNSSLSFGHGPDTLTGECPICSTKIRVHKASLEGYSLVQCPGCRNNLPFNTN